MICESGATKNDCKFLLSCCRGGLSEVAYDIFHFCGWITYVCGPVQSLEEMDIMVSFSVFLHNVERCNVDPVHATHRILQGTGIRFQGFDYYETRTTPGFILHIEKYPTFDEINSIIEEHDKKFKTEIEAGKKFSLQPSKAIEKIKEISEGGTDLKDAIQELKTELIGVK